MPAEEALEVLPMTVSNGHCLLTDIFSLNKKYFFFLHKDIKKIGRYVVAGRYVLNHARLCPLRFHV